MRLYRGGKAELRKRKAEVAAKALDYIRFGRSPRAAAVWSAKFILMQLRLDSFANRLRESGYWAEFDRQREAAR